MDAARWRQLENGRVVHRFEPLVLVAALAVVPVVLLEDASPHGAGHAAATVANWLIWALFTAEVAFILRVAPDRRAAIRAHLLDLGIVLASFPLLPAAFAVTRLARLVRLLRLVRLTMFGTRALRAERG